MKCCFLDGLDETRWAKNRQSLFVQVGSPDAVGNPIFPFLKKVYGSNAPSNSAILNPMLYPMHNLRPVRLDRYDHRRAHKP